MRPCAIGPDGPVAGSLIPRLDWSAAISARIRSSRECVTDDQMAKTNKARIVLAVTLRKRFIVGFLRPERRLRSRLRVSRCGNKLQAGDLALLVSRNGFVDLFEKLGGPHSPIFHDDRMVSESTHRLSVSVCQGEETLSL